VNTGNFHKLMLAIAVLGLLIAAAQLASDLF